MHFPGKKILVTGGAGFLGSHVVHALLARGVAEKDIRIPRSKTADLRDRKECEKAVEGMDIVIHAAGNVGGIGANRDHAGEFFYDNLVMGVELMEAARKAGVLKFVAIGTVCAYPKYTPVPFMEDFLWNGYPEETNAPYALAKKMLLVQAQAYRAQYGFNAVYLLPVNIYGPRDNFTLMGSHVIPALIRKVADAKEAKSDYVEVWGSGEATRDFLFAEDAAEAIVLAAERYEKSDPVNIGSGKEVPIKDLVRTLCEVMDFKGAVRFDTTKPDGQPRRMSDIARAEREFGFTARTPFADGLRKTVEWYARTRAGVKER